MSAVAIEKGPPLLEVEDLSIGFSTQGKVTAITDGVSFGIRPGEMFALVGESGCGKTVTCLSLLRLLPQPGGRILSGRVLYEGRDLLTASPAELRRFRGGEIGMIFQEPSAALNPLLPVENQLLEGFRYHPEAGSEKKGWRVLALDMLERVGIPDPPRVLRSYPHELSGGMLQRVMIAMALLLKPKLLLADEPTTALDVTVQAQILELLGRLRKEEGLAVLVVTHNLNLVAQYADRLAVMYAGRIVERGEASTFFENPLHPYSRGLIAALPKPGMGRASLVPIPGQVPRPGEYLSGCRFRDRCPRAFAPCPRDPRLIPPQKAGPAALADAGAEPASVGHAPVGAGPALAFPAATGSEVSCFLYQDPAP